MGPTALGAESLGVGSIVRFRERLWRVDSTEGDDVFTATPLDGRDLYPRRFAAEIERPVDGVLPFPDPADLGDPADQDLFLRAQGLALVHGSAPIVGLQRSRAIPTPFQLVPLLMTLGEERVRLLIADDVGLGKTIEAGLILAELVARARVRRVLVVCPWNLCEQWQEALEHFFHLDSTIVASHLMPALERSLLPGQSPWEANEICVASVDYLKIHPEVLQHSWDLAVIDEAHLCCRPPEASARKTEKLRWRFAERLAPQVRHLLLLTATPHSGRSESFSSLLELLDPTLVEDAAGGPRIDRERARDHVCQRRRRDVEDWYGEGVSSPFPQRDQQELVVGLGRDYTHLLKSLRDYTDELDDLGDAVPLNAWIAAHIQKRALSSPEALRISIRRRLRRLLDVRDEAATETDEEEARTEVTDDLAGDGLSDEQRSERVDLSPVSLDLDREIEYLKTVEKAAHKVTPAKDPKLKQLRELLPLRAAAHPEAQRVIVFTRYRDTLAYVAKHLEKGLGREGFGLFTIDGELSAAERRDRFAAFAASRRAVLIATDCISEGVNLQHAAAEVVHYELPWNPNRLEQRNGRVDRFGQREAEVGIRTLVLDDPLDMAILERCVRRATEIRTELGYAPPFFAGGKSIRELVRRHGRRRQLSLLDEEAGAEEFFDPDLRQRLHEESFFGQLNVELGEIEAVLDRSRELTGSPERIEEFVRLALSLHGCALVESEPRLFTVRGTSEALDDLLAAGSSLAFEADVVVGHPDADVIDLAHPLLRRLVDLVRDRALTPAGPGRVSAWATPAVDRVVGVFHLLARFVAGSQPPVVLEELVQLAYPAYEEGEVGAAPAELLAAPTASAAVLADDVRDAAVALLASAGLRERIDAELESRAAQMSNRHAELEGGWSAGMAEVEAASWDPVALTLLFPAAQPG